MASFTRRSPMIGQRNARGGEFQGKYLHGKPVYTQQMSSRGKRDPNLPFLGSLGGGGGGGAGPAANALFKDIYGRAMAGLGASGVAASSSAVHGAVGASVAAQELVLNERSRRAKENLSAYNARTSRQTAQSEQSRLDRSQAEEYSQWQQTFNAEQVETARSRLFDTLDTRDQTRFAAFQYYRATGQKFKPSKGNRPREDVSTWWD